jgi:23S rRNA pseudouridine1911/1915/1917 synthase
VKHELIVEAPFDGTRLDRFLAERIPDVSRSLIQKHIELGAVSIGGAPPKRGASTQVRTGDLVFYDPPAPEPVELVAEDIPLSVLYEDEDLVVIDKQRGLVVHPALGHWRGTLVNALLHQIEGFRGIGGELRPGIVHRLDRDTTGAMVIAKHDLAQRALVEMFKSRKVDKRYLAVVWGEPKPHEATIDTLYGRHPTERKRFSSKVKEGKRAITHYELTERLKGASLLLVRLETGRTHQIRVHFADRGHPLIGDPVYGGRKKAPIGFDRPALHASRLAFTHPIRGGPLEIEAPMPDDLVRLVEALR